VRSFETVYLDPPSGRGHGLFYDKAFVPGSGQARHPLGIYVVIRRYPSTLMGPQNMLSIRCFFDSGELAIGKLRDHAPWAVRTYLPRDTDHWERPNTSNDG
jgi:hypothetical protein